MALVHDFFLFPMDLSNQMRKYQVAYVVDGKMERYTNPEVAPRIDSVSSHTAWSLLRDFYRNNKALALMVDDEYVINNIMTFRKVETYCEGYIPFYGLNYYGITLIPWESLPQFTSVLRENSTHNCFGELVSLCQKAYDMKHDILHCGI